jgi:superfamily II DNA or RNA helicase
VEAALDNELSTWLDNLVEPEGVTKNNKVVAYFIDQELPKAGFFLSIKVITVLKNGEFSATSTYLNWTDIFRNKRAQHIQDNDWTLLRMLSGLLDARADSHKQVVMPSSEETVLLLKMMIATERCYLTGASFKNPLKLGAFLQGELSWKTQNDGKQLIHLSIPQAPSAYILKLQPPYYLCPDSNTIGPIQTNLSDKKAAALLQAPALSPDQAVIIGQQLAKVFTDHPTLIPQNMTIRPIAIKPKPILVLSGIPFYAQDRTSPWFIGPPGDTFVLPVGQIKFDYDGLIVDLYNTESHLTRYVGHEVLGFERDVKTEEDLIKKAVSAGLTLFLGQVIKFYGVKNEQQMHLTIGENIKNFHKNSKIPLLWEEFVQTSIPALKEAGWTVIIDETFPYNLIKVDDEWYANVEEGSSFDWFNLELGVSVQGEKVNLVPVLIDLVKKNPDIFKNPENFETNKPFIIHMQDGRKLALDPQRAKTLMATLQHIFSFNPALSDKDTLKMQAIDAAFLAEMEAAAASLNIRWCGGEKMLQLGHQLKGIAEIKQVDLPSIFNGVLRTYQQEGVNWLQFLREYHLAGILADDMGLGKTVQLLAHIAVEKAQGRLTHPFIVIAPTSLMINWKMEADRFVPSLKVLTLHGSERKDYFNHLNDYDLVLTTYPLLARDKEILLKYKYHTIILDEAQTIKNSRAKLTLVANQLIASHRLCLTGTPLENHLGELWSLFNFILPGYLGSQKQFSVLFRSPIEKLADIERGKLLARRIKPFMLRRSKQDVVTELPKKSEIIRIIDIEGVQRDLYETIRVSMHEKVQKEIQKRGADRSRIIVLDALLKLRQVCCDPSLLKMEAAQGVHSSAKRDELINMLTSMVEEGRKILVFSQFTSMLALIEEDLKKLSLSYVKLTGSTLDRETPIRQFQEGDAPIFLISLKAGGTGLNLTAADTVIHYDPWWNPAAERQATDRAYRIGQDKPVFVYKLIVGGTVEEKIVQMQKKKNELMDNLFDPEVVTSSQFNLDDLNILFEPLTGF